MTTNSIRLIISILYLIMASVIVLAAYAPVGAHASLIESLPRNNEKLTVSPKEAILRFNSKIEKSLARFSLTASGGREIPLPEPNSDKREKAFDRIVIPLPELGPGEYMLRYKVMAVDGHGTSGILNFSVMSK